MVEKASLALCVNEAWAMLAGVAVLGFLLVFLAGGCAKERAAH
jgi:DHA2 family multidrug resistance protein